MFDIKLCQNVIWLQLYQRLQLYQPLQHKIRANQTSQSELQIKLQMGDIF